MTRRALALLAVALLTMGQAGGPGLPAIADVQRQFQDPPPDSRIMMRWWWFGPSATRDELDAEMRRMQEGGIGGFEVATVYPLAVDDPARGFKNYPYLSRDYLDAIAFAARRARELGLRMDVTVGSGWSYGGPYITPALAATRLRSDRREIVPGVTSVARPEPYEHDRLIAAFIGRGSAQEADPSTFREIAIPERGPLALPAGDGPRVVLFYFAGPTGQVVKRAAIGAEGYMLDHYSRAAIDTHLRAAGDPVLAAAGPGGVTSIFCDSLEVYDADWTSDLFAEFQRRRGYDLRPLLPIAELGAGERAENIRRDYGRTLTELFEDRFLARMREWAASHRVQFRIQNYGMPPASLASHRFADLLDGEGFEWRTLSATRWAASASHLLGRPVTSSETWTWLHSPAFRATPLDLKAEADLHFLAGINQLIGHGWPYSAPQAGTPGWMFYAAGVYNDKNPWWPVMPDLARYLQRVSFALRQGEPVADVALYAPTEDAWALMRPGSPRALNLLVTIRDLVGPRVVPAILEAGHAFDIVDERTLSEAKARQYKAIVLPGVAHVSEATRRWLADYQRSGGKIVAVKRTPKGEWPTLQPVSEEQLTATLAAALPADVTIEPPSAEIGFVHRRLRDADVYFVANTSNRPRTIRARFAAATAHASVWNPMTGAVERVEISSGPARSDGSSSVARIDAASADPRTDSAPGIARTDAAPGAVTLTLEPYESRIVVFSRQPLGRPMPAARAIVANTPLQLGWQGSYATGLFGGPLQLPFAWTDIPDLRFFSGTMRYAREIQVDPALRTNGARLFLDFGDAVPVEREALPGGTMRGNSFAALVAAPIREAATVFVNGRRAGTIWAPPYRVDVTDLVRDGANELAIDVYNTAINQLAQGGRLPDTAAIVERYGQRFRLQDLDNLQPIPSGILAVPRLIVER